MIISFSVENYRSINKKITLSFERSTKISKKDLPNNYSTVNKSELLNSLIMYGRNASGKSNVLKAFKALQYLVINSDKFKANEKIITYEPFLLAPWKGKHPTTMEMTFITKDNQKFQYCICYDDTKIITEKLYYFSSSKKSTIFERENSEYIYENSIKSKLSKLEPLILPNQLLLSKSSSSNIEFLNDVFFFFSSIIYNFNDTYTDAALLKDIAVLLNEDERIKNNLQQLLKAADTSIEDFTIRKVEPDKIKFSEEIPQAIKDEILKDPLTFIKTTHFYPNSQNEFEFLDFDFKEESLGTKKLFTIGALIIKALLNGQIVIIDELDKSLHPQLAKLLVSLFHSKDNNKLGSQLIFATHDSSLLDLKLFRRDQIVFVGKRYTGYSFIYKLSEFTDVRNNIPIEQWYLTGRFGAVPVLYDVALDFEEKNEK